MIFMSSSMKLGIIFEEKWHGYTRTATGDHGISTQDLRADDVLVDEDGTCRTWGVMPDDVYVVQSLSQLKQRFKTRVLASRIFAVLIWVVAAFQAVNSGIAIASEGKFPVDMCVAMTIAICGCALFTPQAVEPVVHDGSGRWVNLRTGASNLNSGCTIK